jgi:hypothetical protein
MSSTYLVSTALAGSTASGARGLVTVLGTLVFVGLCFALVELVDRRTVSGHGTRTTSFSPIEPGPDVHGGSWPWHPPRSEHDRATRRQTIVASAGGALGSLVAAVALVPFRDAIGAASVALALVLVVVAAAASGGRVAAAIASAAAALSFNFVHAQPLYTFHLRNTADVVTSVLMILVGIAVGEVAVRRFRTAWQGSSAPRRSER